MTKQVQELIEQALLNYEDRIINNPSKVYRAAECHAISKYTAKLIEEIWTSEKQ